MLNLRKYTSKDVENVVVEKASEEAQDKDEEGAEIQLALEM